MCNDNNVTDVTIPSNVTYISDNAFRTCNMLEKLSVSKENPTYYSAGNCIIDKHDNILIVGSNISDIPNDCNITQIYKYAFCYRKYLNAINIPDTVTVIGDYAFSGCEKLSNVIFSSRLTHIGNHAFFNCRSLQELYVPNSVKTIDANAFFGCASLKQITLPDSIIEIGHDAFAFCDTVLHYIYYSGNRDNFRRWYYRLYDNIPNVDIVDNSTGELLYDAANDKILVESLNTMKFRRI